jgi:hypothetical protein
MDMGKMVEITPYPRNTIAMKGAPGPFGDYDVAAPAGGPRD